MLARNKAGPRAACCACGGGWLGAWLRGACSIVDERGHAARRAPAAHPAAPPRAVDPPPAAQVVRTEEAILSCVDHPFLATLYGTLQTGARSPPA